MGKYLAIIEALYKGKQLANPVVWKNTATITSLLTAFLSAAGVVMYKMGYDLGIDEAGYAAIAGVVVLVFNSYVHVASSKKVGLSSRGGTDVDS